MSTLTARSRVAARTTLTIQLLSEWPPLAASSSALYFTDSGIRSVIRATRAVLVSSASSPAGGAGGAGRGRPAAARGYVDHELGLAAAEPDVDRARPAARR